MTRYYKKTVRSVVHVGDFKAGDIVKFTNPYSGWEYPKGSIGYFKALKDIDFEVVKIDIETMLRDDVHFCVRRITNYAIQVLTLKNIGTGEIHHYREESHRLYRKHHINLKNDLDNFDYTDIDDMKKLFDTLHNKMSKKDLQEHMLRFRYGIYSSHFNLTGKKVKRYSYVIDKYYGLKQYYVKYNKKEMIRTLQHAYLGIANENLIIDDSQL